MSMSLLKAGTQNRQHNPLLFANSQFVDSGDLQLLEQSGDDWLAFLDALEIVDYNER